MTRLKGANILVEIDVGASVLIIIIVIAFLLLFKRSEIDPHLTDDSKTQQLQPTTNFNYQGAVTDPNQEDSGSMPIVPGSLPPGVIPPGYMGGTLES